MSIFQIEIEIEIEIEIDKGSSTMLEIEIEVDNSVSFRHSPGGLCPPPPGRSVGPPGKFDRKIFLGGFAPDSILIARRSERRTIRFSLRLCEREEGTGEDGDERRSDWLGWK
jgi:hypothetical protein